VARAHDRTCCRVLGYGVGAQSWSENLAFAGAFDEWRDIAALDAATVARYLDHDGIDIAIDAGGFWSPVTALALMRISGVVRVSWLGNPTGLLAPVYDARIVPAALSSPDFWSIARGYPVPALQRRYERAERDGVQFGADVSLAQLSPEIVAAWSDL